MPVTNLRAFASACPGPVFSIDRFCNVVRDVAWFARCAVGVLSMAWSGHCAAQVQASPTVPGTPMLVISLQEVETPLSEVSVAVLTEAF